MRTRRTETTPVMVVGAGPAGLVAAITLARYGIPSLLVERRADSSSLPRATLINLRTMELLRSWGLEPAVRATAMDVLPRGLITETLATPGMELTFGYPTAEEAAPHSPTYPAIALMASPSEGWCGSPSGGTRASGRSRCPGGRRSPAAIRGRCGSCASRSPQ